MPRTKEQFRELREKSKKQILEAALELFAKKGFDGTSINDIAKAAGISKGLAYNYFSSKEELMVSVLKLFEEEMGEMFSSILAAKDPFEQIKVMINQTFKMLKKDALFWRLYINFALQPKVQETAGKYFDEFLSEAFNVIEDIFKRAGAKNPFAESKILGAILDGISFHYILDEENYPLEKMRRYLIKRYSKENFPN